MNSSHPYVWLQNDLVKRNLLTWSNQTLSSSFMQRKKRTLILLSCSISVWKMYYSFEKFTYYWGLFFSFLNDFELFLLRIDYEQNL